MWLFAPFAVAAAPPAPFVDPVEELATFETLFAVVEWGAPQRHSHGPGKAVVVRAHEDGRVVIDSVRGDRRMRLSGSRLLDATPDGIIERPELADMMGIAWDELRSGLASSDWVDRSPRQAGVDLNPVYSRDRWTELRLPFVTPRTFLSVSDGALSGLLFVDPEDPNRLVALDGSGANLRVRYLAMNVPLEADWDGDYPPRAPPLPTELSQDWRRSGHPAPAHEVPSSASFTSPDAPRAALAPAPCTAATTRDEVFDFVFDADPTQSAWTTAASAAASGCTLRVHARVVLAATGGQSAAMCGNGVLELVDAAPIEPVVLASVAGADCTHPVPTATRAVHRVPFDLDVEVPGAQPVLDLQVRWSGSHSVSCTADAPSASGITTWAPLPELTWTCP